MGVGGTHPEPDAASQERPAFYVYVLACADGTLYTGYTNDVEQRTRAHNAGKGAKYTRSRTPVEVVAQARFATKHEAMSAEFRFKHLSRRAKDRLLARARTDGFAAVLAELREGAAPAPADAGAGAADAGGYAAGSPVGGSDAGCAPQAGASSDPTVSGAAVDDDGHPGGKA